MRIRLLLFFSVVMSSLNSVAAPDFSGVWMLSGPGSESEILLTAEGRRIRDSYDLLTDDPSLACVPASVARIWANPNAGIKIEVSAAQVLISYELFDLRRSIPVGDEQVLTGQPSTENLAGTSFPQMGSSFAKIEDESLIIESRNHVLGYIRTSRGIPQSTQTIAIEKLSVAGDQLNIVHTYFDETLYEKPITLEYSFRRTDENDILIYDCTDADYDWFNELNNNNNGG